MQLTLFQKRWNEKSFEQVLVISSINSESV